jgi:RNA polymerase sigma-70 factor, ECF subfamily
MLSCTTYDSDSVAVVARMWHSNAGKLKRFLARYEHNGADVEDIVQDALLEALRCVERFEGKSSLETWVFGIALNVARHHIAHATRRSRYISSYDALLEQSDDALDKLCLSGPRDDPSNKMQTLQMVDRLTTCVHAMPSELQETFDLLCIQECSYMEASETMGIPIGTVRSRLHRVRSLLKASMS